MASQGNVETAEPTSESSSTVTLVEQDAVETTDTQVEQDTVEKTDTLVLRFSETCRPFKLPRYPEVAQVGLQHFGDPNINVVPMKEGSEEVYVFELNEEVPKYGNSLPFTIEGVLYNVDLKPYEVNKRRTYGTGSGRSNSRDNQLLLTFYKAATRDYRYLKMEQFDNAIQKDLGFILEKPTERQKIKDTPIYNGNRYCVIRKPDNLAAIPHFFPLEDPVTKKIHRISISYNGQLFNCGRCGEQHGRRCPLLEGFYAAKEERERMEMNNQIKTKIISDSTLRHADQLGIRADIMTMPGGGLGQIVQAAFDDPDAKEKANIILVGGTNDIKNRAYEDHKEFIQNIKSTIDKVIDYASNVPDKKITLVNTHPNDNENTYETKEEEIERKTRAGYLHAKLHEQVKQMQEMENPIQNVDILDVEYNVDESGHPTVEGTKVIIDTINDFIQLEENLIWNSDFVTSDRRYRGVQAIYKYGCNHCCEFGQAIQRNKFRNGNLCDDCMEKLKFNAQWEDSIWDHVHKEIVEKLKDPPPKRIMSDEEEASEPPSKVQCTNTQITNDGSEDEKMDLQQ